MTTMTILGSLRFAGWRGLSRCEGGVGDFAGRGADSAAVWGAVVSEIAELDWTESVSVAGGRWRLRLCLRGISRGAGC